MIVIDKDFVRLFSSDEQLIMLRLLLDADENGKVVFCERGLSRETEISYQRVRTIHQKLLRDKIITNAGGDEVIVCKYDSYKPLTKIKTRKKSGLSVPNKPLKERQHDFGISLTPFLQENGGKYPKEMIRAFYDYWTEPNKTQTKMRFELQKTWETSRRLATWANRNNNFRNNGTDRQLTPTDRTTIAAESTMAKLLATNKPVE